MFYVLKFVFLCFAFILLTVKLSRSDLTKIDPNKELILMEAKDIREFFKEVNAKNLEKVQKSGGGRKDKAFLNSGTTGSSNLPPGQQMGSSTLGGILGGATTNLLTAAGTFLGSAAAAAGQAAAAQQAGPTITAMSPAQQLLNLRTCPSSNTSVCSPSAQCLLAGGVSIGNCAMGLLVCCTQRQEIPYTCSATNNLVSIKDKISSVSNNDVDRSCQFEIYKTDLNTCQLQLDFDIFDFEVPLWGEDCSSESVMTVSDSVTVKNGFPLCGKHNGTKMYLAYGRSSRITLSFMKSPRSLYKIRIRQIECNSAERIPDQCLQNYEGYTGLIKSYGFPLYMINNQKYTVCVNAKAVTDNGKITWRECTHQEGGSDSDRNFLLSEYFVFDVPPDHLNDTDYYNYYNFYNSPDSTLFIPSEGFSCSKTTHVEIHGEDKHCGARFLARTRQLTSESRPYMLTVNVVQDSAENLPDFAMYRIPGVRRSGPGGTFPPNLNANECEHSGSAGNVTSFVLIPSTQGFEPCEIITKNNTGYVQHDLCVCRKKDTSTIPAKPKSRPDLLERKGFCLHYSLS